MTSDKVISSNLEAILNLPEISDINKAKEFVNMLSTKEIINSVMNKIQDKDLGIVIGSENEEILLKDCSIVSLNLPLDSRRLQIICCKSKKIRLFKNSVNAWLYK